MTEKPQLITDSNARDISNNKANGHSVLLILDTTHGQIGGTEQNTVRFAQTLLKRGYHPIIVEVGKAILGKSEDAKGLQLYNIVTSYFDSVSIKEWRDLVKKTRPAIIIRSKTWFGCANWRLDLVALLSRATYLGWEHHPAIAPVKATSVKAKIKVFIRTHLHIRSVKKSIAVSHAVREPLISFYPIAPAQIDVIYPGVDFNFFTRLDNARKELRTSWGIPESSFVVGSLGRLVAHKGNDFTLRIVAELINRKPELDIWCVIAGKGSDLARLQKLADSLGISERVRFPGWQESAPKTWNAFDLFLMPSADEGLGMTLIEAVACGCLPLGAAIGGMREILNSPFEHYSLPATDLNAWIEMSSAIATDLPAQRAEKHALIYSNLRERFDASRQWNLMVDWMEKHST
ncbi:hypothetical protein GCM10011613_28680 [Cellvibrio zantedeschiae]|uniref:Glycosyl transferase family 1 domain-containing protein n=1 Tax=Cellvibrio zantedeschiae TaxID=1237077 RepID=A0ABQ3B6K3_9GAMM|nr:glycosyltransferase [Cellvibrio zantedeschiae]GGY82200.1 hypothetical protein GCM10011613_28680 [Cellvibrio zantedeschiae]